MNKCSNDNLFGGAIECRNKKKRHTSPLLILPHMPAAIAVTTTNITTTNVDAVTTTNIITTTIMMPENLRPCL